MCRQCQYGCCSGRQILEHVFYSKMSENGEYKYRNVKGVVTETQAIVNSDFLDLVLIPVNVELNWCFAVLHT
jgi:Ulp1 family protease